MLLLAWILSTSCIFVFTDAGRILVIPPIDSGSHLMSMLPSLKKLASADHQIHIMDFFGADISKYPAKNFHFINLKVPSPESFNMTEDRRVRWFITYNTHGFQVNYWEGDEVFETLLKMHQSKLEEIMEDDWSLVYADNIFSPHAYAIAMRLKEEKNVPYLMFGPSGQVATHICEELALSRNPVVKSVMFPSPPADSEHYFKATSFYYRLYSFSHVFYEIFGFYWIVGPHYMPHIEIFGVNDFSWQNLYKGAAVTFSDSIDRLGWPTSEGMDLVNIGAHCKKSEVLDGELKEFVEDSKSNGTIYLALGTYANWAYAPDHVLNAFANALKQFSSYRIIFSFNGDPNRMPKLPFIKIVKWAPQTAILNHPNTRVFVSHGGLKSIKESLCSKTPLILMPMGAEQGHNAHQLLSLGYGRVLNKLTVTEKKVYNEINHVLQNPYYQERYNRLYDILLDRPIPALDMALFQTERILRAHNNEVVFKRKGIDLYWYEYLYVQLASVLLGAILLLK